MRIAATIAIIAVATAASAVTVTIRNDIPRRDTRGHILNAHSGNIVGPILNGTYFLYGENYGEGEYTVQGSPDSNVLPKLAVYSSRDLVTWEWRGYLHNNTSPGWAASPTWPYAPKGTWWSPSAIWNPTTKKVVIWFSASQAECCAAKWGIAQSSDGVHFELVTLSETPASGASIDGSWLFLDDDGAGYVAFDAMNVPGRKDHIIGIERLAPDLLSTTKHQVGPYFPARRDFAEHCFRSSALHCTAIRVRPRLPDAHSR